MTATVVSAPLVLTGSDLTLAAVYEVAWHRRPVALSPEARDRLAASRAMVARAIVESRVIYGVTTGFGRFSDVAISADDRRALQVNLIRSHAAGVGPPLSVPASRAMLLLRANALACGFSGVRPSVVDQLIAYLNHDLVPVIPSQGSVGASGDLAPLAHVALTLIGEGEVWRDHAPCPTRLALEAAGLKPLALEAKEGLALINGTQAMSALGALTAFDAERLADWADMAGSLSFQVLRGIPDAFDPAVVQVRPHPGAATSAAHLRRLLEGSRLTTRPGERRVQDAYSLRCMPQVHGASRDAVTHVVDVLTREINSVTDNPLLFPERAAVVSAGNFHGQPLALALDYLGMALAEWANISERRIERLVNPALSGLPAFLVRHGGLNSGLMLAQYTAASLVSENKVWAHPASVDSIPTSANQEDHVSMGMTAARKAWMILDNVRRVLAVELLCAAQAADFVGPDRLSPRGYEVWRFVRQRVAPWEQDRVLSGDIERLADALVSEAGDRLRQAVLDSRPK
ncbi:MAG: histidine ammonia-lyase [Firmicutes bacterium]|nr:histidine ammonia-lyase [Bacillota bacterium]